MKKSLKPENIFIVFKPWSYETLAAKMLDKSLKNDEAGFAVYCFILQIKHVK